MLSKGGGRDRRGGKDSNGFREVTDRKAGKLFLSVCLEVFVLWRKHRTGAERKS